MIINNSLTLQAAVFNITNPKTKHLVSRESESQLFDLPRNKDLALN